MALAPLIVIDLQTLMFDGVADRYDLTNAVLSLGRDRTWRAATVRALDLAPGALVLDLAAGTGTSSRALAAPGALVVACDFSLGMLRVGRRRDVGGGPDTGVVGGTGRGRVGGRGQVSFVAGDGTRLPFADGSFDAATISFGLRNVADPEVALRELARVTRSGGRLVVCEFSRPVLTPLRVVYLEYLMRVLPELARRVSSNPEAYVYLAESIRAWPDQQRLGRLIRSAGWGDVAYRNLTGGIVALHRAVRR